MLISTDANATISAIVMLFRAKTHAGRTPYVLSPVQLKREFRTPTGWPPVPHSRYSKVYSIPRGAGVRDLQTEHQESDPRRPRCYRAGREGVVWARCLGTGMLRGLSFRTGLPFSRCGESGNRRRLLPRRAQPETLRTRLHRSGAFSSRRRYCRRAHESAYRYPAAAWRIHDDADGPAG